MKYWLGVLFLVSTVGFSSAQEIKGIVLNAEQTAAEFASVRLFDGVDSTVVTGAYVNAQGEFFLEKVEPGDYYLMITFPNHAPFSRSVDFLNGGNIDLGTIQLSLDQSIDLEEVQAVGSLDVLKAGIDKKVYSVEEDLSVRGGSVNDVLDNIPSIEVDQDGNISLRGDGNVTILIDGRPSTLVGGEGQSMLDALPANSIERIEVVTNPSSKYDPDGTSGIINIVLKKNKLKGFNGLVSATAATGDQYEANLGLSYRNRNFNLFLNYSFNSYEGYRNYKSDLYRTVGDSISALISRRTGKDQRTNNTLSLGTDFYFNENTTFSFMATGSMGERVRTGELENRFYADGGNLSYRWDRDSRDPRENQNFDVNINFSNKFKNKKGEWSLNANQSFENESVLGFYEETYYTELEQLTEWSPLNQQLENSSKSQVTTVQTDFSHIFEELKGRLEYGAKVIVRNDVLSTYSETLDTLTNVFYEDTIANYDYQYDEGIYSLYASFGQELGKFKYQIGARGEYAEQAPYLITTNEKFLNSYVNLYPSAHTKYTLSKTTELSLSYSRRINRPSSWHLNPFTSYADPLNLRRGNPALTPEYIDSYDFGVSFVKKKVMLSASVFHRRTKDVINRVKLYNPDNSAVMTFANIDKSESTGFESVIILKPYSWLSNTFSVNGNYIKYTNTDPLVDWNNDGFNWGVKNVLSADFWKKTMSAQVNIKYSAPRTTPQGIVQRGTSVDVSLEKRLLNNRLSVSTRVSDIFNTLRFTGDLEQMGVQQSVEYKWLTRRWFLTVSYKIGKFESKSKGPSGGNGGDDD